MRINGLGLALAVVAGGCYPNAQDVRQHDPTLADGSDRETIVVDPMEPDADPTDTAEVLPDTASDSGARDTPSDPLAPDASVDAAPDVPRDISPELPPPPFERHCALYAQNLCARFRACARIELERKFGTEEMCRARVKISCDLADLPGSRWPSRACAEAYPAVSCSNFNNNVQPPPCLSPGERPDGTPCADESQCESRRCVTTVGNTCGTCGPRRLTGGPCLSNESCFAGLVCALEGNKLCVASGAMGAPCGPNYPCQAELFCLNGSCTPRGGDDTPCTNGRECDAFAGVGCSLGPMRCRTFTVEPGTCRTHADGTFELCRDSGFCKPDGTCVFVAEDGQACSIDQGPNCRMPATCVSGTCTLPDLKRACDKH